MGALQPYQAVYSVEPSFSGVINVTRRGLATLDQIPLSRLDSGRRGKLYTISTFKFARYAYHTGSALGALALVGAGLVVAASAVVQDAAAAQPSSDTAATQDYASGPDIVVTGTFKFDPGDGIVDSYVGTQAPDVLSSGAGTPRWRANWMNSLQTGAATLTSTSYFTSGYKNVAVDESVHGANTCADNLYGTGDLFCSTRGFFDMDLVGQVKVNEKFTFYINVVNLFDASAPLNPPNYAGVNYNPIWTQQGIIGRYFRAGANFKF